MIVFLLGPSEHIHHCIQLPSSPVQVGRDPEESFINTTTWIHETITNLPGFQDSYSCLPAMTFTPGQQGATALRHFTYPRMPLVFQKMDAPMCAAVTAEFANPQWRAEAVAAGVSLGTIVIAGRTPPTSAYISFRTRSYGPFLGVAGII